MLVYLRDGSPLTIVRAATLRQKLQLQLSISLSHSILTLGQPVQSPHPKRESNPDLPLPRRTPKPLGQPGGLKKGGVGGEGGGGDGKLEYPEKTARESSIHEVNRETTTNSSSSRGVA